MSDTQSNAPGRPRCSNCGHDLTGAVRSASCPECGRPLVEVLVRDDSMIVKLMGRRYTSRATLLGMPAVSIAMGVGPDGKMGHARGWIAIGDRATGVIALGGMARGVVAIGGMAMGIVSLGGLSLGVLGSLGGLSVAILGLALGGLAAGLVASGGMALGVVTMGGACLGWYAWGPPPSCIAMHIHRFVAGQPADAEAAAVFEFLAPLIGGSLGRAQFQPMLWLVSTLFLLLVVLGLPAVVAWQRGERDPTLAPPTSPR